MKYVSHVLLFICTNKGQGLGSYLCHSGCQAIVWHPKGFKGGARGRNDVT